VPHADRFQNEYLPPSEEDSPGSPALPDRRPAVILAERAVLFVDAVIRSRPATRPTPSCSRSSIWSTSRRALDRSQPEGRPKARVRSLAAYGGSGDGSPRPAPTVGAILVAPSPTRSMRPAATARPRPTVRSCRRSAFAGEPARKKLERIRAEIRKLMRRAGGLRSARGRLTFNIRGADVFPHAAAAGLRDHSGDGARLYVDESKLTDAARDALAGLAGYQVGRYVCQTWPRLAPTSGRAPRSSHRRPRHFPGRSPPMAARFRAAPIRSRHESGEERHRDRRQPRRAIAATAPLSQISLPGSIAWRRAVQLTEIGAARRSRPFADTRGCSATFLPDHLGRRPERRHRALSRHPQTNRKIAPGRTVSHDSAPVSGRHLRHHAP